MGLPQRCTRSAAHTSEQPHRRAASPQLEASELIAFIAAQCVVKRGTPSRLPEFGDWAFEDAMARGQYTHPSGVEFGGFARQWSGTALTALLDRQCALVEHVAYMDWHSLVDRRDGELMFLCFNDPGDPLYGLEGIDAVQKWIKQAGIRSEDFRFLSRIRVNPRTHLMNHHG